MTTVLLLLVCLFGVVLFVQLGALVEMYGQLQQVRDHLNMFDSPTPLELGVSQSVMASSIGLPAELDQADDAVVLLLSNKCQTCFDLGNALSGGALPQRLWLVVVPVSGVDSDGDEFIDRFGLRGPRILVDTGERIVKRLGLDISPAALVVTNGRLEKAQTVPTVRQMYAMLPTARRRRVLDPTVGRVVTETGNGIGKGKARSST